MKKVRSLHEFAGVPKGTTGNMEQDGKLFKITWDGIRSFRGTPYVSRPVEDWFNDSEVKKYLVIIK